MTHAYLAGEAQAERIRVAQVMSMRFRICKRRLKGKLANALSSAAAVGGRLRRTVRPDGQNGYPHFDDGLKLRKSKAPPRRRNACKIIAGRACYARASGQKG